MGLVEQQNFAQSQGSLFGGGGVLLEIPWTDPMSQMFLVGSFNSFEKY